MASIGNAIPPSDRSGRSVGTSPDAGVGRWAVGSPCGGVGHLGVGHVPGGVVIDKVLVGIGNVRKEP